MKKMLKGRKDTAEEKKEFKKEVTKIATPSLPKTIESKVVANTIVSAPTNG